LEGVAKRQFSLQGSSFQKSSTPPVALPKLATPSISLAWRVWRHKMPSQVAGLAPWGRNLLMIAVICKILGLLIQTRSCGEGLAVPGELVEGEGSKAAKFSTASKAIRVRNPSNLECHVTKCTAHKAPKSIA